MLPTEDLPQLVPDQVHGQIPAQIGRYRILGCLGVGGMGAVYKAHDPQLNRIVAVKLPRFDGRTDHVAARFQREARAAASVRHPHVCPIYDVGEHEGQPYVVMAYIEGESLAAYLVRQIHYQESPQSVDLIRQVLNALEAVHDHGIVHRDLKPSNILLDAQRRAILTDFGLARPAGEGEGLTSEGIVVGTPAYMAPEQAAGQIDKIGPWTDLYSLGVILYQMLTGRLPFEGPALKVMAQIVHESPPRPSSLQSALDPALDALILKAMAREPHDRFQSAHEFRETLARCCSNSLPGIQLPSDPPGDATRSSTSVLRPEPRTPEQSLAKKPRAYRVKALFVVVIFAVVVSGIALYRLGFFPGSAMQAPSQPIKNPAVTRENYAKIKQDMDLWDVTSIMGPGEVAEVVESKRQRYFKYERGTISVDDEGNPLSNDAARDLGKKVGEGSFVTPTVKKMVWRSGDKAIHVTFVDDKVAKRKEENLFRE